MNNVRKEKVFFKKKRRMNADISVVYAVCILLGDYRSHSLCPIFLIWTLRSLFITRCLSFTFSLSEISDIDSSISWLIS